MIKCELASPCYVIHTKKLDEQAELLKASLEKDWPDSCVGYSIKTCNLPWAVKRMQRYGFYAEAVSPDEYSLAKLLGFEHIIYNGPVKSAETFLESVSNPNHIVNLDAWRELDWLKGCSSIRARIGIRVNFDLESLVPGETSGGELGSRFGFSYENGDFGRVLGKLADLGIKRPGLHLHVGSKTRSLDIYRGIAAMAARIGRETGLEPSFVDVGGGYFGGMDNRPQYPDYVRVIREELLSAYSPSEVTLIMEPGTSLITPPVEYRMTVTDVRDSFARRIVTTDGSRTDVDPLHTKSSYFHRIDYCEDMTPVSQRKTLDRQYICGFTCMEHDILFILEDSPELLAGDVICFDKVGGYTMGLTPQFIRFFPAVYRETDGEYACVRRPQTAEDFLAGSVEDG